MTCFQIQVGFRPIQNNNNIAYKINYTKTMNHKNKINKKTIGQQVC